jgi:PAS domain S-box-containing protein
MVNKPKAENNKTISVRCFNCNKLLAKNKIEPDQFEIKCLRCGNINIIIKKVAEQVIITDTSGKILFVNGEVENVTGYRPDEVLGKDPNIWGGQMPKEFYDELWRIISVEKKTAVAKLINRHKSGSLYNAVLRISPVMDSSGDIVFFVGIENVLDQNGQGSFDYKQMPIIDS